MSPLTDDVRLAVVGFGVRSSELTESAHRPGTGSRIVAACDTQPQRREAARARYGTDLRLEADYRALLDAELDGVLVATPDHTHVDIAAAFLEAGIPTFVEKPLAITTDGCDRILDVALHTGTRLYVGHNMRHMPVVRAMRDLVQRGAIGQVKAVWCRHFVGHGGDFYFKDWHADRRNTTGLLVQKGVHDIDVIHWLAGAGTKRVTALGGLSVYGEIKDRARHDGLLMTDWLRPEENWPPLAQRGLHPVVDVEDLSMMLMQLDGGAFASYQQCHFTPDYWRNYTVIGTEGRLENFGDEDAVVKVWQRRSDYRDDADLVVPVSAEDGAHAGTDQRIVNEFIRFIRDGAPTVTSPIAARDAVAAACAATASLRAGGCPVDVPRPDPAVERYFESVHLTHESAPTERAYDADR
ncbi:Gfo/Idh/MocA family protein [Streptomyces anandii]|uniref:Gfo/Idh/MocA family protein n=1 Tax=Streptomyces anandii TaxID=285454 RepID=UPI0036F688F1